MDAVRSPLNNDADLHTLRTQRESIEVFLKAKNMQIDVLRHAMEKRRSEIPELERLDRSLLASANDKFRSQDGGPLPHLPNEIVLQIFSILHYIDCERPSTTSKFIEDSDTPEGWAKAISEVIPSLSYHARYLNWSSYRRSATHSSLLPYISSLMGPKPTIQECVYDDEDDIILPGDSIYFTGFDRHSLGTPTSPPYSFFLGLSVPGQAVEAIGQALRLCRDQMASATVLVATICEGSPVHRDDTSVTLLNSRGKWRPFDEFDNSHVRLSRAHIHPILLHAFRPIFLRLTHLELLFTVYDFELDDIRLLPDSLEVLEFGSGLPRLFVETNDGPSTIPPVSLPRLDTIIWRHWTIQSELLELLHCPKLRTFRVLPPIATELVGGLNNTFEEDLNLDLSILARVFPNLCRLSVNQASFKFYASKMCN